MSLMKKRLIKKTDFCILKMKVDTSDLWRTFYTSYLCLERRKWHFLIPNHVIVTLYQDPLLRTGITGKKISCYVRKSACRWCIVKKAKIFRSSTKHIRILPSVRNYRILIGLGKEIFMSHPVIFNDR